MFRPALPIDPGNGEDAITQPLHAGHTPCIESRNRKLTDRLPVRLRDQITTAQIHHPEHQVGGIRLHGGCFDPRINTDISPMVSVHLKTNLLTGGTIPEPLFEPQCNQGSGTKLVTMLTTWIPIIARTGRRHAFRLFGNGCRLFRGNHGGLRRFRAALRLGNRTAVLILFRTPGTPQQEENQAQCRNSRSDQTFSPPSHTHLPIHCTSRVEKIQPTRKGDPE